MTTAAEIIEDALSDILVRASESPIPADEMQSAIRIMNRMVASWNLGIGYTNVTDASDDLTVIQGAELAIQQNLAVALAPSYDAVATVKLEKMASKSLRNLKKIVITTADMNFPSRLAKGSGNTRYYDSSTFYPAQGAELTQENGGAILLEP